jgi:mannosyltransferase
VDVRDVEVIAPNLKRRYSGVTSTVLRLVPVQARDIGIAAAGPVLPEGIPRVPLSALPVLPRDRWRVWHARRNVEMLAGLMMRGLLGRRLKLLFTSAAQRRHSAYTRWLLRRMDAVVATSARAAGYLERPATVIRHGIDTDLFHPVEDRAALRRGLGLPEDGLVIGCFGRVRRQKGTDLFVEAMISVLPEHPGAVAVVMGGVTKDQEGFVQGLRTRIAEPGWRSAYGFLPRTGAGASPLVPGLRPVCGAATVGGVRPDTARSHGLRGAGGGHPGGRVRGAGGAGGNGAPGSDRRPPRRSRDGDPGGSVGQGAAATMGRAARERVLREFRIEGEAAALLKVYRGLLDEVAD